MLTWRRTLLSKENINCRVSSLRLLTASDATHLSHTTGAAVATTQSLVAPMHALGVPLCPKREATLMLSSPRPCALPPVCLHRGPQAARRGRGGKSLTSVPEMLLCTSVPLAASLGSPFLMCPAPCEVVPGPPTSLQAKLRQLQSSRQRTMHFLNLRPFMVWESTAPLGAWPPRVPAVSLCV